MNIRLLQTRMLQINESTCKRADDITWRNNTVVVYVAEIT